MAGGHVRGASHAPPPAELGELLASKVAATHIAFPASAAYIVSFLVAWKPRGHMFDPGQAD